MDIFGDSDGRYRFQPGKQFCIEKISSEQIIKIATICQSIVGIVLAAVSYFGGGELYSTIFLFFFFYAGRDLSFLMHQRFAWRRFRTAQAMRQRLWALFKWALAQVYQRW